MHRFTAIIVLVLLVQGHADDLTAKRLDNAQDAMDQLIGILVVDLFDLEKVTFGKSCRLAARSYDRLLSRTPPLLNVGDYSFVTPCISSRGSPKPNIFPGDGWRHRTYTHQALANVACNAAAEDLGTSISELRKALSAAVNIENYEEAARIRDQIAELQLNPIACVQEANEQFYEAFCSSSTSKMRDIWGRGSHVRCMHPGMKCILSSDEVLNSWDQVFSALPEGTRLNITTESVQVHAGQDWGVVSCVEHVDAGAGENVLVATNIFELQNGQWVIIHHQASVLPSKAEREVLTAGFLGKDEEPGRFAYRVGDILVHRIHGQVGVVVERFDRCQLGPQWMAANGPPGMNPSQPFYSILVSTQGVNFTRHGAQSSHRRWDSSIDGTASAVHHPDVSAFFGNLDVANARYQPLDAAAAAQEVNCLEWDKRID